MAFLRLRRAVTPVAAALALALSFTGLTVMAAPAPPASAADETAGDPFDCSDPRYFAMVGGTTSQLYTGRYVRAGQDPWTTLGGAGPNYNALAFNTTDNFLYGVGNTGILYRIDSSGAAKDLGASGLGTPPRTLWDSGVIVGDTYYVANRYDSSSSPTTIHRIHNLANGPRTSDTISIAGGLRFADLTEKDGYLWAVEYNGNGYIHRIDLATGTSTTFSNTPLSAGAFASAFTMTNGNLAFINASTMYQVAVTNPGGPATGVGAVEFTLVSSVPARANSQSDAANCASALQASLSVTKVGPATVDIGGLITWTVTVKNNGPGVTSGYALTDILPAGLTNVQAQSAHADCVVNGSMTTVTCNGGRMSATPGSNTHVVTITANAPTVAGPIVNSVRVVGNEDPDPDGFSQADTDVVLSTTAGHDVSLPATGVLTFPATTAAGGGVTHNSGSFTYTPPPGFSGHDSFVYTTSGGSVTVYIAVAPTAPDHDRTTPANTAVTVDQAVLESSGVGTGLELTCADNATNGTVALNGDGDAVFTPREDFSGAASFDYRLTDDDDGTVTATVDIIVTPTAAPSSAATRTNTPVTVSGSSLSGLGEGSGLDLTSVSAAAVNGTVALASGTITFTPVANFSGIASFGYTLIDSSGRTATNTVTVTVSPVAAADTATVATGESVSIDALGNDRGTALELVSVATPSSGDASVDNGQILYEAEENFSGTVSFTYTLRDSGGRTATATATVTVTPHAAGIAKTTPTTTPITVAASDLVATGSGSGLTYVSASAAVNGTLTVDNGSPRFTPTAGFSGPARFTYLLRDTAGVTAQAIAVITVTPVAANDTATTVAGSDRSINVLANDLGSGLALVRVLSATGGTAAIDDGEVVFTPTAGYSGPASVTYEAKDSSDQLTTASVAIAVTPKALADSAATDVNEPVSIDVLANDLGSTLTLTSVSAPGLAVSIVDGEISYVPAANVSGTVTFTYTATDASAQTTTATVTVRVLPTVGDTAVSTSAETDVAVPIATLTGLGAGTGLEVVSLSPRNGSVVRDGASARFTPDGDFSGEASYAFTLEDDAGARVTGTVAVTVTPTATGSTASTRAETDVTITVASLVATGTGTSLSLTSVQGAVNGAVTIDGVGVVFSPTAGFSGTGTFTYTLADASGGTVTATVTVTVAPVARDDSVTTEANSALPFTVIGNDLGANLSASLVAGPLRGTLALAANGSAEYTPSANFSGVDSFEYRITGDGGTDVATVTILVTPLAVPSSAGGAAGGVVTIDVGASGKGTGLTVTSVIPPAVGTAIVNPDGTISYTPPAGFSGRQTLRYTVTDHVGLTATSTVTVSIAPTAAADSARTAAGEPVTITTLANDIGTGLTVIATTAPRHGTVTINADGTLTYTARAGYSGSDSFSYTVQDAAGSVVTASVSVTVIPSLQATGVDPGGLMVIALALLGLGGTGLMVHAGRRPRSCGAHRG